MGTQVLPGCVVGGNRRFSGTVAKLSCLPPRGPCSWKMPPVRPLLAPGLLPTRLLITVTLVIDGQ
jgi:hypothetical protein